MARCTNCREAFNRHLPAGWLERLLADCDTAAQYDLATMNAWPFDAEDAARINAPVLNLKGEHSTAEHHGCHDATKV